MVFFFHLVDGVDILLDPDGRDLPDLAAAKAWSLKEARSLLSHEVLSGTVNLAQAIEVHDETGAVVHILPFGEAISIS